MRCGCKEGPALLRCWVVYLKPRTEWRRVPLCAAFMRRRHTMLLHSGGRHVRCAVCWRAGGACVGAAAATRPPCLDTLNLGPPRAQVEQRVVDGLLGLIAAERGGETVDRGLLSNLLRCFTSLGMYATAFQARPVSQVAPPGVPGGSSVAAPPPAGARLPRRRLCAGVVLMRSAPEHAQRPAGLLAASGCALWQRRLELKQTSSFTNRRQGFLARYCRRKPRAATVGSRK